MYFANKKIISYLIYTVKIIIGFGFLIYVLKKNNIQIKDLFGEQVVILLAVLIVFQAIIFILSGIRWVLIVRSMTTQDLTIRKGLMISWIGLFFSSFLPGIVSSDITRFYYINKISPGFKDNVKTIITDRIIGLISLILLSAACLVSYIRNWSLFEYGIVSLLIFSIFIIVLSRILEVKRVPKSAFLISYVTFSLKAFSFIVIILFLGLEKAGFSDFYLAMFGQIFEIIPLTPVNVGVGHFVYDLIYNLKPQMVGAVIYNYYFLSKVIFKLSGILAWISFRR